MNWLRVHIALLDTASAVAAFAANWLLQSTLLIAAGLFIAYLARRRGAALLSAIYRTTLAAAVVCPLATFCLSLNGVSGWSLPMPAAWQYEELPAVASAELDGVIETAQIDFSEEEAPPKSPVEQASRLLARRPPTEQARRLFYDVRLTVERAVVESALACRWRVEGIAPSFTGAVQFRSHGPLATLAIFAAMSSAQSVDDHAQSLKRPTIRRGDRATFGTRFIT